jgi:hypothetical protein
MSEYQEQQGMKTVNTTVGQNTNAQPSSGTDTKWSRIVRMSPAQK